MRWRIEVIRKNRFLIPRLFGILYGIIGLLIIAADSPLGNGWLRLEIGGGLITRILLITLFSPAILSGMGIYILFNIIVACREGVCSYPFTFLMFLLNSLIWGYLMRKMNLNPFKPKKLNVILFGIFLLIFIYVNKTIWPFGVPSKELFCVQVMVSCDVVYPAIFMLPLVLALKKTGCGCNFILDTTDKPILALAIFLTVIYWWILSCIIASILEFIWHKWQKIAKIKE